MMNDVELDDVVKKVFVNEIKLTIDDDDSFFDENSDFEIEFE